MKKLLLVAGVIVVLGVSGYWLFGRGKVANEEAVQVHTISATSELPNFPFTKVDGTKMNAQDLKGNVLLILFNPDCDHCQREAEDFKRHLPEFKNYSLYFISSMPMQEIAQFGKTYQLIDQPNVVFGWTETMNVINTFGSIPTPSVYLYGSGGERIQSFEGETAVEVIAKYLK